MLHAAKATGLITQACKRVGVEPHFDTLNGIDPVAFILAQNVTRRHLSTGQKAMALAFVHLEPDNVGRGKKGKCEESAQFSKRRLEQYPRAWQTIKVRCYL
jgi:hypothetical protein